MSKHQKNLILTISITTFFVLFLTLTLYAIYCYGYYEKSVQNTYVKACNSLDFNNLFKDMNLEETNLTNDDYLKSLSLLFNKEKLKSIYREYYQKENLFLNEEDFLKKYFYNNQIVTIDDIDFDIKGKTTLLKRAEITLNKINIKNTQTTSSLGIVKNITIKKDGLEDLLIGDEEICSDSICHLPYYFGGVYEVRYKKDNTTYYSLLNISKDNSIIDIALLEDTIKFASEEPNDLVKGKYYLRRCTKTNDCPVLLTSYLLLEDTSCYMYTFISYSKTNDRFYGTYKIENGFLKISFDKHVYTAFDFDTQEKSDIEVTSNMEYTFKIIDSHTIQNNDYLFST